MVVGQIQCDSCKGREQSMPHLLYSESGLSVWSRHWLYQCLQPRSANLLVFSSLCSAPMPTYHRCALDLMSPSRLPQSLGTNLCTRLYQSMSGCSVIGASMPGHRVASSTLQAAWILTYSLPLLLLGTPPLLANAHLVLHCCSIQDFQVSWLFMEKKGRHNGFAFLVFRGHKNSL